MPPVDLMDKKWMRVALGLAHRGLGQIAPNPAVGCVLLKDHIVIGRGWTQPGGRPHAETEALGQAGASAHGATAYVTLEPCAHTGKTPPCAMALVNSGVQRVVIAASDPDPRVSGKGISVLQSAGIEVVQGILEKEATYLNRGFFNRINQNRPTFTLKTASTLDGKIALANGESKWITGERARTYGHLMRSEHDGILVGANTVIADDPSLTCRIPGLETRSPIRIVLDSDLRISPDAAIFSKDIGDQPTLVVTKKDARTKAFNGCNVEFIHVETPHDLGLVARALSERGLNSILIEGGSQVAASFLSANLVDDLCVFSAGKLIGNNGLSAVGDLNLVSLPDAPHFTPIANRRLGPDMLATYRKAR